MEYHTFFAAMDDSPIIDTEMADELADDVEWVKPTCIKHIAIGGGYLGTKEIKVPWQDLDGYTMVEMSKANRQLARAIGLKMGASPFKSFDAFTFLKQRRDAAIDDLIKKFMLDNDETADKVPESIPIRLRYSLFGDANIPIVVEVNLPELASNNRDVILEPCAFRMKSPSRRDENVWIEFDSTDSYMTIIEWLKDARSVELPITNDKKWGDQSWGETAIERLLPQLEHPYVYRKRNKTISVRDKSRNIEMKLLNLDVALPEVVDPLVQGVIVALKNKSIESAPPDDNSPAEPPTTPTRKLFGIFESARKRVNVTTRP